MIDKNLFKLLGKNKKYIFIVVILMVLSLLLNLNITYLICKSLNKAINKDDFKSYISISIIILICIILRFILTILISNTKDILGRNVKKDLRDKMYDKILTLGTKNLEGINMAGLTQISIEGIEQLDIYYSTYLPQFFYAMIAPFILFAVTVNLYWKSTLTLILLVPLIPVSIIAVSKYANKVFAKYWSKYISIGDGFLDSISGLKDLKIFSADKLYNDKMNKKAEDFRRITMKVLVMQLASTTIMDLVAYGGAGLGIAFVIIGLKNGNLSSISTALFITLVSVEFFLPMRQFGSTFHIGMNGASAGKKILTLLNEEEPIWNEGIITNCNIQISNLNFSYNNDKEVLKNINMSFNNKGFYGIVGQSGSGKSTLANLLCAKLRPQTGEILIGGKELSTLSRISFYSHVGLVSYNTYLFNESIRDNFIMAKPNIKNDEIYKALSLVNMTDFVNENGGLNYVIKEDSLNISGGERQRLCLAISIVSNKDIYIFDEASSNIDIESEEIILKNIQNLSKDKLVIMISHRLANLENCNLIYLIENGILKEEGTHKELLNLNGLYKTLYDNQILQEKGYMEV